MSFLGCSYGHLIFSFRRQCRLVDVFTGTVVMPPRVPSIHGSKQNLTYATLLAPLASPESYLLIGNRRCLFLWQVGSDSWSDYPLANLRFFQIIAFQGEIFAMDYYRTLFTIRLAPQLRVEELAVVWEKDKFKSFLVLPWLVACGDMLLLVNHLVDFTVEPDTYEVFHLDRSAEPAKWVKVEKLENWALFISYDRLSLTFACMSPERWGGKSGCIHHTCINDHWIVTPLGHGTQPRERLLLQQYYCSIWDPSPVTFPCWVVPSMFYVAGQ